MSSKGSTVCPYALLQSQHRFFDSLTAQHHQWKFIRIQLGLR
jgi:hypothetical protein